MKGHDHLIVSFNKCKHDLAIVTLLIHPYSNAGICLNVDGSDAIEKFKLTSSRIFLKNTYKRGTSDHLSSTF